MGYAEPERSIQPHYVNKGKLKYCKLGNYCVHLLLRSSEIFTDCDIYYCEAWSPPVQMDTYDSEMRGFFLPNMQKFQNLGPLFEIK
jgi:hypothetical protein